MSNAAALPARCQSVVERLDEARRLRADQPMRLSDFLLDGQPFGVPLPATADDIAWGKAYRARQDVRHAHHRFPPPEHDPRWCGHTAERVIARYLSEHAHRPFRWFLGGIDRAEFFRRASFYERGAVINQRSNGQPFVASEAVYDLQIADNLTPPLAWLRELELRGAAHAGR